MDRNGENYTTFLLKIETISNSGPWDDGVGLFIPSHIMEMAFKAIPDPPNDITKLLSLLAWVLVDTLPSVKIFGEIM